MKIIGTPRGDDFFATATLNEEFIGRGGSDSLTLFPGDTTDSYFGGKGFDGLGWSHVFDWTNEDNSNFGLGITFNGGRGADMIFTKGTISEGATTLTYSFLGVETTSVENIVHFLEFSESPDLVSDLTIVGSAANDTAIIEGILPGQQVSIEASFGGGGDQLFLAPVFGGSFTSGGGIDLIDSPRVALQSLNVSMGRGPDHVDIWHSVDGAVIKLGRGNDLLISDGYLGQSGIFAETFIGGKGRDTFILNSATTADDTDTVRGGGGRDRFVLNKLVTNHTVAKIEDFKSGKDQIIILDNDFLGQSVEFDFSDTSQLVYLSGSGRLVHGTSGNFTTVLDFGGPLELEVTDFSIQSEFELFSFI